MALHNPSDFYDAISAEMIRRLDGISVDNYNQFGDKVIGDGMVLIEFERGDNAGRKNDGRIGHNYSITLHGVVGRHRHRADLEALNLSAAIERVVVDNRWQLPWEQISEPSEISSAPSIFKHGADGYEAWGVSFNQTIYLGKRLAAGDDPVKEIWATITPPADPDDIAQYQKVDNAGLNISVNSQ